MVLSVGNDNRLVRQNGKSLRAVEHCHVGQTVLISFCARHTGIKRHLSVGSDPSDTVVVLVSYVQVAVLVKLDGTRLVEQRGRTYSVLIA